MGDGGIRFNIHYHHHTDSLIRITNQKTSVDSKTWSPFFMSWDFISDPISDWTAIAMTGVTHLLHQILIPDDSSDESLPVKLII